MRVPSPTVESITARRRRLPAKITFTPAGHLLCFHKGRSVLSDRWYCQSRITGLNFFLGPDDEHDGLFFVDVLTRDLVKVPSACHSALPSLELAATMAEAVEAEHRSLMGQIVKFAQPPAEVA